MAMENKYFRLYALPLRHLIRITANRTAMRVYIALCTFADYKTHTTRVTNLGISRSTGIARRTIAVSMAFLEQHGYITITYKKRRITKVHGMVAPLQSKEPKRTTSRGGQQVKAKAFNVKEGANPLA